MKRIEELLGAKTGEVVSVVPRYVLITNGFGHEITELASHVKNPDKALVVYDHNLPAGLPGNPPVCPEREDSLLSSQRDCPEVDARRKHGRAHRHHHYGYAS